MGRAIDLIYDKLTRRNFRCLEERHTVIEWLDPGPDQRILDIGCGDGFHDRHIALRGAKVARGFASTGCITYDTFESGDRSLYLATRDCPVRSAPSVRRPTFFAIRSGG